MKTPFIFQLLTAVICIMLAVGFFIELSASKQLKQERDYFANRLKNVEDSLAALPDSIIFISPTNQPARTARYMLYPYQRQDTLWDMRVTDRSIFR